jgi:hypothetical protein
MLWHGWMDGRGPDGVAMDDSHRAKPPHARARQEAAAGNDSLRSGLALDEEASG